MSKVQVGPATVRPCLPQKRAGGTVELAGTRNVPPELLRAPRTISAFDDFCLAERAVAAVVPRWVPDRGRLADRALLLHDATRTPPERTQAGAAATRSS